MYIQACSKLIEKSEVGDLGLIEVPLLLMHWAQSCALSPLTEHSCGGSVLHKNKNAENGRTAILISDCELAYIVSSKCNGWFSASPCTLLNSSVYIPMSNTQDR